MNVVVLLNVSFMNIVVLLNVSIICIISLNYLEVTRTSYSSSVSYGGGGFLGGMVSGIQNAVADG
jgi:hypothetical protein